GVGSVAFFQNYLFVFYAHHNHTRRSARAVGCGSDGITLLHHALQIKTAGACRAVLQSRLVGCIWPVRDGQPATYRRGVIMLRFFARRGIDQFGIMPTESSRRPAGGGWPFFKMHEDDLFFLNERLFDEQ